MSVGISFRENITTVIPQELMKYPQWVMWRGVLKQDGKLDKLPLSPHTGGYASVSDPTTWGTFDIASGQAKQLNCGIGFVLTDKDPFGFIDLDSPDDPKLTAEQRQEIWNRHQLIAQSFNTYQELSPSGKGLHLICYGNVPEGKRRSKVEIYSSKRFMTVTGQTWRDVPISDCGYIMRKLWEEMGGSEVNSTVPDEQPERYSDEVIYKFASEAHNGEKFLKLWSGDYVQAGYPSQSEADFALINIICFYSRNTVQVKRMFKASALGQRDKANRASFVDPMIRRSFDNQPAMVDLTELIERGKEQLSLVKTPVVAGNPFAGPLFETLPAPEGAYIQPPGLLGEIAQFIFDSSVRQVHEVALAAAIGLMAGICGRAYNVSNTGLNQYILLLAKTGVGKEGMSRGIDRIMNEVEKLVPAAATFIGPSAIASGQALIRQMGKTPCCVAIVGEFGLYLQSICAYNANSSQIMLRKNLLELYMKSGEGQVLRSTIYSTADKDIPIVASPAFSLLGESTPSTFYGGLDEGMIQQGLLPRFLTIQYDKKVPYINENTLKIPSPQLIQKIADLITNVLTCQQSNRVIAVNMEEEAVKYSRDFSHLTTDNINQAEMPVLEELWNRAHLKTLKLAALIAVGWNPFSPVIDLSMMKWSKAIVERDIASVVKQFESGFVGGDANEVRQIDKVSKIIKEVLINPYGHSLFKSGVSQLMYQDKVLTVGFFQRKLLSSPHFKTDRIGANAALKRVFEMLVQDGALRPISAMAMHQRYQTSAIAYAIIDTERFTRE